MAGHLNFWGFLEFFRMIYPLLFSLLGQLAPMAPEVVQTEFSFATLALGSGGDLRHKKHVVIRSSSQVNPPAEVV
jgi:hypothetical protein